MHEIEKLMLEQVESLKSRGLTVPVCLWCHYIEWTRPDGTICDGFAWTVFGTYCGIQLQLSANSLELLDAAVSKATAMGIDTREVLLSL